MNDLDVIKHPVRVSISAWQNPRQPSDACGPNEAGFAAVTSLPACRRQEPGASKGTVNFVRVFERGCCVKEIYKKARTIALINVFTVEPANQQRLVDLLARATDGVVDRAPGFVSSTLHRSIDGTKVTMYAQWRSAADYHAMRQDPGPLPFLEEALTIAKFEPGIYEIVRTFLPAGERAQGPS